MSSRRDPSRVLTFGKHAVIVGAGALVLAGAVGGTGLVAQAHANTRSVSPTRPIHARRWAVPPTRKTSSVSSRRINPESTLFASRPGRLAHSATAS